MGKTVGIERNDLRGVYTNQIRPELSETYAQLYCTTIITRRAYATFYSLIVFFFFFIYSNILLDMGNY